MWIGTLGLVIYLVGWVSLLRGIAMLLLPAETERKILGIFSHGNVSYVAAVVTIVLGAGLLMPASRRDLLAWLGESGRCRSAFTPYLIAHAPYPTTLCLSPAVSPELRKSIRSIVRPRRFASVNAPRMARSPQASAGPIILSSKASIDFAVRDVVGAGRLIVLVMREVRADNEQRVVGPNLSDSCGNGTG